MSRLTDNDKQFGPVTMGWCDHGMKLKSLALENFGEDDNYYGTCLTFFFNRLVVRLRLPHFLKPYREWREAGWDEATIKRLGRDGYWHCEPREFGASLMDGHVSMKYGRQGMDSSTDKSCGFFLPWTQWRMVRFSIYDNNCSLFWESAGKRKKSWDEQFEAEKICPKQVFKFKDYDGQEIIATTHIEEREWLRGEKWCKWLSWFSQPKIRRSLDIEFSDEVGPRKGSWKGGTIGHGIDMQASEYHETAFRRYCANGYNNRGKTYPLTYIEKITG